MAGHWAASKVEQMFDLWVVHWVENLAVNSVARMVGIKVAY